MLKDALATADALQAGSSAQDERASDSSKMLLGLMALARRAEADAAGQPLISRDLLRSLLSALQVRDISTLRHSRRTARLAVGFAKHLGCDEPHLKKLEVAGLLHDIGKVGVPDNVLFKPGRLQSDEAGLMALHRDTGLDVLQACRTNRDVLDMIAQSQGAGGSRQSAPEVGACANVLAIADAYDSLCTDQVFREAMSHEEALQTLSADPRFDGEMLREWASWIAAEGASLVESGDGGMASPDATEAGMLCSVFSYLYVLESLYDGFYLVSSDMRIVVWNPGAERLLGHAAEDMLGRSWTCGSLRHTDLQGNPLFEREYPLNKVVADGRGTTQQVRIERADAQWAEVESQSVPLIDRGGTLQGVAEIFRDLTRMRHRRSEFEQLKMAASRDPLTSLANRSEIETQLADLHSDYTNGTSEPFSVMLVDIDWFKQINDSRGHAIGDRVLVEVSQFLQGETYSGELIGRYGGEEFVVVCPDTDLEQAAKRAERLRVALARATLASLAGDKLTASFGIAQVEQEDTADTILGRAEEALKRAKEGGRNAACPLTRAQQQGAAAPVQEQEHAGSNPFLYEGTFEACVAADMIVYKLGGFVNDHHARIKQVSPKRTRLQLGSRSLLGMWGAADSAQPVQVELEFAEQETAARQQQRRGAAKYINVRVTIRPLGWIRNSQTFQERAKRVMKLLRSYFVVG